MSVFSDFNKFWLYNSIRLVSAKSNYSKGSRYCGIKRDKFPISILIDRGIKIFILFILIWFNVSKYVMGLHIFCILFFMISCMNSLRFWCTERQFHSIRISFSLLHFLCHYLFPRRLGINGSSIDCSGTFFFIHTQFLSLGGTFFLSAIRWFFLANKKCIIHICVLCEFNAMWIAFSKRWYAYTVKSESCLMKCGFWQIQNIFIRKMKINNNKKNTHTHRRRNENTKTASFTFITAAWNYNSIALSAYA